MVLSGGGEIPYTGAKKNNTLNEPLPPLLPFNLVVVFVIFLTHLSQTQRWGHRQGCGNAVIRAKRKALA